MEYKEKEPLMDTIHNLYYKASESKSIPDNYSREQFMVLILWLLYKDTTITDIIQSKNKPSISFWKSVKLGIVIGIIVGFSVSASLIILRLL